MSCEEIARAMFMGRHQCEGNKFGVAVRCTPATQNWTAVCSKCGHAETFSDDVIRAEEDGHIDPTSGSAGL